MCCLCPYSSNLARELEYRATNKVQEPSKSESTGLFGFGLNHLYNNRYKKVKYIYFPIN
jgi:hypothetical protein